MVITRERPKYGRRFARRMGFVLQERIMRRRLSAIALVVVSLFLFHYAIRWLTLYWYFDGQPLRSFLLVDNEDFRLLLESDRALTCYRAVRTTFWLMVGPVAVAILAYNIRSSRTRLLISLRTLGMVFTALGVLLFLFGLFSWNGRIPVAQCAIGPLCEVTTGGGGFRLESPSRKQNGLPFLNILHAQDVTRPFYF